MRSHHYKGARRQRGFAYIAAVLILVVMASLSAAMVRLNNVQQSTATQDVLVTRASQAARAGAEWGLFQLRAGGACPATTTLTDFLTASGFRVTVSCTRSVAYNEGEQAGATPTDPPIALSKFIYQINATACNAGASCPENAQVTQADYVERRRVVTMCMTNTTPARDCY